MKRTISFLLYSLLMLWSASLYGYTIQVGDVVRLYLPGEEELDKNYDINYDGKIVLPEIGSIKVAGLTEKQAKTKLRKVLSTVYRDLRALNVYIDKRQVLITVSGYVNKPGQVSLEPSADIQIALIEAGGIRSGAQLDKIQLRRSGTVTFINYKAYLDSGDVKLLPKLKSNDTLFVPASPKIGNVEQAFNPANHSDSGDASEEKAAIKVFGEVRSPGSFSYKDGANVIDILMRAGGVTRFAGVESIRVIKGTEPELFNLKLFLDTGDESLLPNISPGITIFVPKQEVVVNTGANTIYVMGEVIKSGAYEGKKGMSFMDILANAGGPTRFAETRQIRIIRSDGKVDRFDLAAYTEGLAEQKIPDIAPGDAIFVPEKTDMNEKVWTKVAPSRAIHVMGEVTRPGRYEWTDEMSLIDLLAHAGGASARGDTSKIIISRRMPDGERKFVDFDLDAFMRSGKPDTALPKLYAGSVIKVDVLPRDPTDQRSEWVLQASDKSIYVFGEVNAPGRYRFDNKMSFLDILAAAQGPTGNADLHNIRISHRNGKYMAVSKVNLATYFETGDESLIPKVKTEDTIYIPAKDRNWLELSKESTVRVLGNVNKPGRYQFNDKMTLLDILAEAGGTNNSANLEKITIINKECCEGENGRIFNLTEFMASPVSVRLPPLRPGDTVFVPDAGDGFMAKARQGITDIVQVMSLIALISGL